MKRCGIVTTVSIVKAMPSLLPGLRQAKSLNGAEGDENRG